MARRGWGMAAGIALAGSSMAASAACQPQSKYFGLDQRWGSVDLRVQAHRPAQDTATRRVISALLNSRYAHVHGDQANTVP